MGSIVLVTGGARSGKSVFAERYVQQRGRHLAYIATAQAYDGEMRRRIALHQARRGAAWTAYETPFDAELALGEAARTADAVLFDCLTLYVSNMLCAAEFPNAPDARFDYVRTRVGRLLEAVRQGGAPVVFVTNEVGMGIVPDNALAREFRDLAGLANQQVAAAADAVYLVVSGLAVNVKKLAEGDALE